MTRLVLSILLLILTFESTDASVCQIFKFHSRVSDYLKHQCDKKALSIDTDHDGLFDWNANLVRIGLKGFPKHLNISGQDDEIKVLQKKLHLKSGINALTYNTEFSPLVLNTLINIFDTKVGLQLSQKLSKLRYFFSFDELTTRNTSGLYLEPIDAIALRKDLGERSEDEIFETLAHEIGHAVLFSLVTPNELGFVASDHGGWQLSLSKSNSLYAKQFMARYHGLSTHQKTFPSAYAYSNTHEWFAENFAHYLLENLGRKNQLEFGMKRYFDSLIYR